MKKILIVNANYYNDITKNLVFSASKILKKKKFKIYVLDVTGVFELPLAIRKNINRYDAFIAIGCVIKGKTPHFDLICKSSFDAIMNLSINYNKPIGNGIITALSRKQALERSRKINSKKPNKGLEAAHAVISILKNGPKEI